MQRHARVGVPILLGIAMGAYALSVLNSQAAEPLTPQPATGEQFMRAKLATTSKVVEGLATEDFALIEEGAEEWLAICESASWKVRRNPMYMHYTADFQHMVAHLREMAKQQNIQGATFAYMHVTVSCMSCHQHVRGVVQIAPATSQSPR